VATGAGLDVAASFIEHETVLTVAIPVGIFLGLIYALYYYLVRRFDPFHMRLLTATGTVVALALAAAVWGRRHGRVPRDPHVRACRHGRRLRDPRIPASGRLTRARSVT
jgi:hypothetical protein